MENRANLLFLTGNQQADSILRGVIGIWEAVFPGRVRGYYLLRQLRQRGRRFLQRSQISRSCSEDRFQSDAEADRAQTPLWQHLEAMHPAIPIDMFYVSEEAIHFFSLQREHISCKELESDVRENQLRAVERLEQIHYSDPMQMIVPPSGGQHSPPESGATPRLRVKLGTLYPTSDDFAR